MQFKNGALEVIGELSKLRNLNGIKWKHAKYLLTSSSNLNRLDNDKLVAKRSKKSASNSESKVHNYIAYHHHQIDANAQ